MWEIMITMSVIAIVSGFAVINVARARENMRLVNAAHELQSNVERARGDAVRRHGSATVQALDATRYQIGMDVDGDGTIATAELRTVLLPVGVNFDTNPLPAAAVFDWRGRVPANIRFTLRGVDDHGLPTGNMADIPVTITAGGDISINSNASGTPPLSATPFPTLPASPGGTPSPSPTP